MIKTIFKKGQKYGDWVLDSLLGSGGNGEVWKCENSNGKIAAIKLLKSVRLKSYKRFLSEVSAIERNSDIKGLIPIWDKFLPANLDNDTPYYVMPVAQNITTFLHNKSVEIKIESIISVAITLSKLHARGISHRDIKPPNILVLENEVVIADFGLVDYPDKPDISLKYESIGPKWTMAPEMKRESSNADGAKADVYSLAKSLWIILTNKNKGFDGQYSADSILDLSRLYKNTYTKPIDDLLSRSTDNDPNVRPSINDFIDSLEKWKTLHRNFHRRNLAQWFEVQTKLFPTSFPKRVVWEEIDDIIAVLNVLASYDNLNHVFLPTGGGLDLQGASRAAEEGCLILNLQLTHILKPKRLMFESFGYDPSWNYFRLEADKIEETNVYKDDEDSNYDEDYEENLENEEYEEHEEDFSYLLKDSQDLKMREYLSELSPGQYYKDHIMEDTAYYRDSYPISDFSRKVTRWLYGSFVIFNKRSPYNMTSSTYDGRHNKMDADKFRDYIQNNVSRVKQEEEISKWTSYDVARILADYMKVK